jgi:hypothetical protein
MLSNYVIQNEASHKITGKKCFVSFTK